MQVDLSLIKPAPDPVRNTWDEGKMVQLAESVKQDGMLQPIKVRPLIGLRACRYHGIDWLEDSQLTEHDEPCFFCNEFRSEIDLFGEWEIEDDPDLPTTPKSTLEVVFGHRRLEAAIRAGLDSVPVIIAETSDDDAHRQALIENMVREDMTDLDKAIGIKHWQDMTGETQKTVARRLGLVRQSISNYLQLLRPEIRTVIEGQPAGIGERLVQKARIGVDDKIAVKIIRKAKAEDLSSTQAENISKSIGVTRDPRRREMLLETPYSTFIHDPEINRDRAERYGASDPMSVKRTPPADEAWRNTPEVKAIIERMRLWDRHADEFEAAIEAGKLSPEAEQFIGVRLSKFIHKLQLIRGLLEF